jgi:Holliday junction resolvasome RuvABC endonuclease subunit
MTALLALDLGTVTGYAVSVSPGSIVSGVWNNKGGRYEGGGMRFLRFRSHLDEIHRAAPVDVVYFEEVRRHIGTDAAHIYGGMLATLTAWCEEMKVPYEGVPVGSIKKFVAGKGNASKDDVLAAVRSLGYQPKDDNEADAIALCIMKRPGGRGVMNDSSTLTLDDLVGEHFLDGVDGYVEKVKIYGSQFEDSSVIRFRLDGVVYVAFENPSDGYRSSMDRLVVSPSREMTNTFPAIRVVARKKAEDVWGRNNVEKNDVLELIDAVTGMVVLEVGTRNTDDYYPAFVSAFSPENMAVNQ